MTLPRYPAYRDSGVEWLGEVPAHWDVVRLKRLASIRYGIGEPPAYIEDGVPLIRATNVHEGRVLTDGLVFVDPAEIPEKRIFWLQEGDIIVVRSGAYTGDTAIIRRNICPAIAGFDMVVRVSGVVPDFLQFALLSSYLKQDQIDLERARAAQPHLNAEELGGCLVVLPSLDEQIAIAAFLDRETAKIDGLVREQERLIELLAEKRRAVVSHAVTKGLDRHAPMKDSGIDWLGEVPAHWEVMQIKRVAVLQSGDFITAQQIEEVGTYPVFGGNGLRGYTEAFTHEGEYALIGRQGALCGNINYAAGAFWASEHAVVVLPRVELVVRWLGELLRAMNLGQYSVSAAQPGLSVEALARLQIPVPPFSEQYSISKHLDREITKLNALKAEAERAIALLKERRAALISAAVTGKIDVRGRAEEAA